MVARKGKGNDVVSLPEGDGKKATWSILDGPYDLYG
jgi:hypothetical protein